MAHVFPITAFLSCDCGHSSHEEFVTACGGLYVGSF